MTKQKSENVKVSLKPTQAPPPLVVDSRVYDKLQANPDHTLSVVGIHSTFLLIMGPLSDDPEHQASVLYNQAARSFSRVEQSAYFSRFIQFREPGGLEKDRLPAIPEEIRAKLLEGLDLTTDEESVED